MNYLREFGELCDVSIGVLKHFTVVSHMSNDRESRLSPSVKNFFELIKIQLDFVLFKTNV